MFSYVPNLSESSSACFDNGSKFIHRPAVLFNLPSSDDTPPVLQSPPEEQDHGRSGGPDQRPSDHRPALSHHHQCPNLGPRRLLLRPVGQGQLQVQRALQHKDLQPSDAQQHPLRQTRPHGPQLRHHQEGSIRHPRQHVNKSDYTLPSTSNTPGFSFFDSSNIFFTRFGHQCSYPSKTQHRRHPQPSPPQQHTAAPYPRALLSISSTTSGLAQRARVGQQCTTSQFKSDFVTI